MESQLPQQPELQPSPPISAQQTPMPQKTNYLPLLLVMILILIGIASYLGYQNWQLKQQRSQIQLKPIPPLPPIPTAKADDQAAAWKTINVTSEPSFGLMDYQVKIPNSWEQIAHSSSFQNVETFQDNPIAINYQVVIDQQKNFNTQTGKPYSSLRELTGLNYDVSTTIVAGLTAAKVLPRAGNETNFKVLFFSPYNKQTISLELVAPRDGTRRDEGEKLFNQILSTFKFINQTTNTSNWKTYPPSTILGLHYSFKYPPEVEESEAQDLTYLKSGTSTLYHHWVGKTSDINALMNNYQVFGAPKVTFSTKSTVALNKLTGFKAITTDGSGIYFFLGNPSLNGFLVFNYDNNDLVAENLFNNIAETISVK